MEQYMSLSLFYSDYTVIGKIGSEHGKNEYKKPCSQKMIEKGAIKKINLSDELKDKRLRQKGPESGQSKQGGLWTGKRWSVPI